MTRPAGASIAIDDCYELWESGFISIPFDFQVRRRQAPQAGTRLLSAPLASMSTGDGRLKTAIAARWTIRLPLFMLGSRCCLHARRKAPLVQERPLCLPCTASCVVHGPIGLFQTAQNLAFGQRRTVDMPAQVNDLQPELQKLLSAGAASAPLTAAPGVGGEAAKANSIASQGGEAAVDGGVEFDASGAAPAWPAGSSQGFPAETLDLGLGQGLEQSWGREGWGGGAGRGAGTGAAGQEDAQVGAGFPSAGGAAGGFPGQTSAERVAASCLRCSGSLHFRPGFSRTRHRAPPCLIGRYGARWPGLQESRTGACVARGAAACRGL